MRRMLTNKEIEVVNSIDVVDGRVGQYVTAANTFTVTSFRPDSGAAYVDILSGVTGLGTHNWTEASGWTPFSDDTPEGYIRAWTLYGAVATKINGTVYYVDNVNKTCHPTGNIQVLSGYDTAYESYTPGTKSFHAFKLED